MLDTTEQLIESINRQIIYLYSKGQYEQALSIALEIYERASQELDNHNLIYATYLNNLARLYYTLGEYEQAVPLYRQVIDIRLAVLGEHHPEYANSLNNLAAVYQATGEYNQAEQLYRQATDILRSTPDQGSLYAISLNNLAELYHTTGRYNEAKTLYCQAGDILRAQLGEQHLRYATNLNNRAGLCIDMGHYNDAEALYREAGDIVRTQLGEQHLRYATNLNNRAGVHKAAGRYDQAETFYHQANEILRASLGDQHPDYANGLNNLAELYVDMGYYDRAQPLFGRAAEIIRMTLGDQHLRYATSLNNLAGLYRITGRYDRAEPLYSQAQDIIRTLLGVQHPRYATSLNNLAELYIEIGRYPEAEQLLHQVEEILRTALGEQHPRYATSLNNLAELYIEIGRYPEAEQLHRQVADIRRTVLGDQHPDYATSLNNLAWSCTSMGRYDKAEPLYLQAAEIRRTRLGENHRDYAGTLSNLAVLYGATRRVYEALQWMQAAETINNGLIGQMFSISSERQRLAYLETLRWKRDAFLSLVVQHFAHDKTAVQTAFELVLRRKAMGTEALVAQRDNVLGGRYPGLKPKLQELSLLRAQIAQKMLAGPNWDDFDTYRQGLAGWNEQQEQLEEALASQIPEMRLERELRSANCYAVAAALPNNSVLIEFVRMEMFDFAAMPARGDLRWRPARYLAFVLRAAASDDMHMVDLGEAALIDQTIADFRATITGANVRDLVAESLPVQVTSTIDGKELRETLFDPLAAILGDSEQLFIAPDGDLARLPFEILPADDGTRLIDSFRISYLGVGRDVLRFDIAPRGQPSAPLVIADPDFDLASDDAQLDGGATEPRGRQSKDLNSILLHFTQLPGTRQEGERIAELLGVQPLLQGAAVEQAVKANRSPRILHVATHGFFLPDQSGDIKQEQPFVEAFDCVTGRLQRLSGFGLQNPMLRSGLALAGANTWLARGTLPIEAEDAILNAEDVSGLDLVNTELVVLSACETGLGRAQVGEGVFGLRRAFVLAGTQTLVMSLWKVPDQQTQELMVDFYQRILADHPRADALRQAQLALKQRYPHPFFWGAFICQGNPNVLPSGV